MKHRILHYTPNKSGKIVIACFVLYNMWILAKIPVPDMNDENVEEIDFGITNNDHPEDGTRGRNVNPELIESRRIRDNIARCLYNK